MTIQTDNCYMQLESALQLHPSNKHVWKTSTETLCVLESVRLIANLEKGVSAVN